MNKKKYQTVLDFDFHIPVEVQASSEQEAEMEFNKLADEYIREIGEFAKKYLIGIDDYVISED